MRYWTIGPLRWDVGPDLRSVSAPGWPLGRGVSVDSNAHLMHPRVAIVVRSLTIEAADGRRRVRNDTQPSYRAGTYRSEVCPSNRQVRSVRERGDRAIDLGALRADGRPSFRPDRGQHNRPGPHVR